MKPYVQLFPLKSRGSAVLVTLELLRAVSLTILASIIFIFVPFWLAINIVFLALLILFWLAFVPALKKSRLKLLAFYSRPILGLTHILKFITLPIGRKIDHYLEAEPPVVLRADLERNLSEVIPDNTDLSQSELNNLIHSMNFYELKVFDIMEQVGDLKKVRSNEILSPAILNELHATGRMFFPVFDHSKEVIGTLSMADLSDIKASPEVVINMKAPVYINQEEPAMSAIFKYYESQSPVFVVLDDEAEFAGLLSLSSVLNQLVPKPTSQAETIDSDQPVETDANNTQTQSVDKPEDMVE